MCLILNSASNKLHRAEVDTGVSVGVPLINI